MFVFDPGGNIWSFFFALKSLCSFYLLTSSADGDFNFLFRYWEDSSDLYWKHRDDTESGYDGKHSALIGLFFQNKSVQDKCTVKS